MTNEVTLERVLAKEAGETCNFAMDFAEMLEESETLSTIDVTEVTTSALTITLEAVNTTVMTVNDLPCQVGKGVTFRIAGGTANTRYKLKATVTTSLSATRIRYFYVMVL